MARRSFALELDAKIKAEAVTCFLKPAIGERLVRDAGYIQGLKAASDLFLEVYNANTKEADER